MTIFGNKSKSYSIKKLISYEILEEICENIGIEDLYQYFNKNYSLSQLLLALLGITNQNGKSSHAQNFVKDFIFTKLINQDLFEFVPTESWLEFYSENIETKLKDNEFRLLRRSGANSVMPFFVVGLYDECKMYGYGAGETVNIAKVMAKLDATRRYVGLSTSNSVLRIV